MRIVCFGQQNWDFCWTAKQQIITRLARRGHQILYVDPDSREDVRGFPDSLRALAPDRTLFGIRAVHPGVTVYTHRHAPALRWRLNQLRRRRLLARVVSRLGFDHALAIVLHPAAERLFDAVSTSGLIYFAVDEATAFPNMSTARQQELRSAEHRLLNQCDVAVAVSPRLAQRFQEIQPNTILLENAADLDHFSPANLEGSAPHEALRDLPHPRIGLVGQIDERVDQDLVGTLADRHPAWQFVLAGRIKQGVDFGALRRRTNVHLIGYQPYDALPGVLRELDVCMVPYRQNDLTHACNPLKVYEYLATGRPVVSTPLDGLGATRTVIRTALGPDAFERAIEAALLEPDEERVRRLGFAARHGWDARVDVVEDALTSIATTRSPRFLRTPLPLDPDFAGERLSTRATIALRALTAAGRVYHAGRVAVRLARGQRPAAIRRILVARRCRLGDLVVFLPALRLLRRRFPHAHIVLGVQRGAPIGALRRELPVDEVRELEFLDAGLPRLSRALALFMEGFDLTIGGGTHFLVREALCAGTPYRAGLQDGHPLQRLGNLHLPLDASRHEAENNAALVDALCDLPPDDAAARVPVLGPADVAGRDAAAALLHRSGVPGPAPLVLVHPGAQKPSRRWPAERFGELVLRLVEARPGTHVLLTGVTGERPVVAEVLQRVPPVFRDRVHDVSGHTSLQCVLALAERSRLVICNDTGTLHLARARGAPLLALLGPENHRRWGPHPLGPGPAVALRHEVPCAPCVVWQCDAHWCMRALSVDEAFAAALEVFDRGRLAPVETSADLHPLQLHLRRHSWRALDAAGADLPLVSAVVLGRRARARGPGTPDPAALAGTLEDIGRQRYPRVEVVLVSDVPHGAGPAGRHAHVQTGTGLWRRVLAASRGSMISVTCAGARWEPDALSRRVEELMRHPQAAGVGALDLRREPESILRRACLEQALSLDRTGGDGSVLALLRQALSIQIEDTPTPPPLRGQEAAA